MNPEVWPQKSLLEDLVDAELGLRQLNCKHFVAGEVRTIENCTDAMEIMGRLQLIRHMAYLKIRGNEWSLIRTMYAEIVRAIETGEHSVLYVYYEIARKIITLKVALNASTVAPLDYGN